MSHYTKNQIQNKSDQYENLILKYEQLQKQNNSCHQKIAKLESTLEVEANRIIKEEKLYEAMLQNLKSN